MKRQYWAIGLLIAFLIGIIGVYAGFIRGDNTLATYGLFMAIPAAVGSFVLKRDLKREIQQDRAAKEQPPRDEDENSQDSEGTKQA